MQLTETAQADPSAAQVAPQATDPSDDTSNSADQTTAQFISFTIGEEEYGVDIMAVREIKGWTDITRLPNTPEYVRGVLNLRGVIVPIFDLRSRFDQGKTEATNLHVVIVIAVNDRTTGILVDAVSDILTVGSQDILPVPEMDSRNDDHLLSGLVTVEGRMVALLNLNELFDIDDIDAAIDNEAAADD